MPTNEIETQPTSNPVYLMVREVTGVEGAHEGVGIEWGVDWGTEELPEDVEDLNEAQYTVWQFIKVIKGIGDEGYLEELKRHREEKPSGIIMPAGKKTS